MHFGTSEEYWRMVAADSDLAHTCGWSAQTSSWLEADLRAADDYVLINAEIGSAESARATNEARSPLLVALPEGDSYLGFIFARGATPEAVEAALREAHGRLHFEIAPGVPLQNFRL